MTGLILPCDLETDQQLRIEQFAGFGKGYERRVYRASEPTSALFPFAAGEFGSGACTALRADVARALGGFDPALGTGTPARGGEDLDLFVRVLTAGYALVYEPAAVLWHEHPDGVQRLNRELFGYGIGLAAMLTKQMLQGHAPVMLRGVPEAWRFMRDPVSRKNVRKPDDYPRMLEWIERAGMVVGPVAYAHSRRRTHANEAPPSPPYRPAWIGELNVAEPLQPVAVPPRADGGSYERAHLLVRAGEAPVGFIDVVVDGQLVSAASLTNELQRLIAAQPAAARETDALSHNHPALISVVVCTRDRPESLLRTLSSVLEVEWNDLEVVVVDNAPATDGTRRVVDALDDRRLRYVREPAPGLSRARNRALVEARGEIVAFTDDDVVVDPGWLRALASGFARSRRVACVTGFVAPAELETAAQAYFEAKVKWSASLRPRLFDLDQNRGATPMFPYDAGELGAGANFAVRRSALAVIGSFDEALGAGSPAEGGEDLDFFARVILAGCSLAFEPNAIVWHEHRRDTKSLRRQMHGYGAGFSAYAFKHMIFGRAAGHVARVVATSRAPSSRPPRRRPILTPIAGMRMAELRGVAYGPWGYLRGRHAARRRPPLIPSNETVHEMSPSTHRGRV